MQVLVPLPSTLPPSSCTTLAPTPIASSCATPTPSETPLHATPLVTPCSKPTPQTCYIMLHIFTALHKSLISSCCLFLCSSCCSLRVVNEANFRSRSASFITIASFNTIEATGPAVAKELKLKECRVLELERAQELPCLPRSSPSPKMH
jgi:hypothetical protein